MIPTYNESKNIGKLIDTILLLKIPNQEIFILVVDDNSPDGTGKIVQEYAKKHGRVGLLTRYKNRGRGFAGIDGYQKALDQGADYVVEMDADFSHHPKYIPALLQCAQEGADVVLGSRFVPGGSDSDRSIYRQIITKFAGTYIRTMLRLQFRDVSSGFRCFSRKALQAIEPRTLKSSGPSIILETLYRSAKMELKIVEAPIVFFDRKEGTTKLNLFVLIKTLLIVFNLRRDSTFSKTDVFMGA